MMKQHCIKGGRLSKAIGVTKEVYGRKKVHTVVMLKYIIMHHKNSELVEIRYNYDKRVRIS